MTASFSAQVAAAVLKAKGNLEKVIKESAQDLTEEITRPVKKGGNMPVKTGFLRTSLVASTSYMPSVNPSITPAPGTPDDYFTSDFTQVAAKILTWRPVEQRLYLGFTAAYARPREYDKGFVRLAAQNWPQIVDANVRKVSS